MSRRYGRWVAVWTAVGLVVRVGYVLIATRDRSLRGDPFYYHGLADLMRRGAGWSDPYLYQYLVGLRPTATHPPLYPLALTVGSWLGFDSELGHRLFSCFIGTATIPIVALVGRRYAGPRAGIIAAALTALYPYLWTNDANVRAESLLALAIALVLLVAEPAARQPTTWRAFWLGVTIGLAALTRSERLLLVPLLAWPLLLRGSDPVLDRVKRAGAATLAALLVLAPWMTFNLSRAPVVAAARVGRIWGVFNPRQTRLFDQASDRGYWPTVTEMILFYPMLVLSVVGLVQLRRRRVSILPFVAVALAVTVTAASFAGAPRLRVPADVGMVVLTAVAIDVWLRSRDGTQDSASDDAPRPAIA
jgi:4-amino-4-deoxy-L-arabinose transferase-like glycosyltransferase